jgi:hypothetical protein
MLEHENILWIIFSYLRIVLWSLRKLARVMARRDWRIITEPSVPSLRIGIRT